MQCRICGSKWESKAEVTKCPFCGQSLQIQKRPNETNISDVIAYVISIRGCEILKKSKIVISYVMDLVQGHEREKKLFRILCNYDIFSGAYKIITTTDLLQRDIIIKRLHKILTDEAFLSEAIATDALNIVLRGIGEKELCVPQANSMTAVSSETLKMNIPPTLSSEPPSTSKSNIDPQTKNVSQKALDRIDTFYKYQKALKDYYVRSGKMPLTESQIRHFLSVNSLDRNWGITIDDVQKDLKDIYAKYTPIKPTLANTASSTATSRMLFNPGKKLSTYKTYMDELEQVFIRNGKVMLSRTQIADFIEAYGLRKRFGITVYEVESDLRLIMINNK